MMTSGKHFLEPIKFAIKEVPSDQFWYFGAPPASIVSQPSDLFRDHYIATVFIIAIILLGLLIYIIRIKKSYIIYVALLALIYGLFSVMGILGNGWQQAYVSALFRVEVILLLGISYYIIKSIKYRQYHFILMSLGTISVFILGAFIAYSYIKTDLSIGPATISNWKQKDGNNLGLKLSPQWQTDIDTTMKILNNDRGIVWSTYAGVPEAELNQFQPSGYDYIIHALGPQRRKGYVEKFIEIKPKYVITMRKDFFAPWQQWLENENWDFFKHVNDNYSIVGQTSHTNIWKKNDDAWVDGTNERWTPLGIDNNQVNLGNLGQSGLLEIRLKYNIKNRSVSLPYVQKIPRYLVHPIVNGQDRWAASLPPYMNEFIFPLYIDNGDNVSLRIESTHRYLGSNLDIYSIEYRKNKQLTL